VSALATVAVTYAIGVAGWGRRVGISAALLLSISAWHLTYSREAYAEADMVLFATSAYFVYLRHLLLPTRSDQRSQLYAGLLFGLAFACNTRAAYAMLVLAPTELLQWRARGWCCWPHTFKRAIFMGVGFVAPLALIEGVYLTARVIGRGFGAAASWPDYAQQLVAYWQQHPVIIRFDQWPSFPTYISLMDGVPVLLLLAVGLLWALVRPKRPADVLLLTALIVPVGLYSIYEAEAVRMRAFSIALPWIMLAAALGLNALARLAHRLAPRLRETWLVTAVLAFLALIAIPRTVDLITAPNGIPSLLDYLHQAGVTDVASTDGAVLGFFVGEQHTNAKFRPAYINTPDDLVQLASRYQYVAAEMQGYLFPNEVTQRFLAASPVFAAPHGSATWYLASLFENRGVRWGEWDDLLANWQRYRAAATEIRLEDLDELGAVD